MKIKRVVAYGCSFTAGEEAGDHEVYEIDEEELDAKKRSGYTLQQPSDEYISFKQKFVKEKYDGKLIDLNAALLSAGKKNSYVRFLSDLLEVPYSNRAVPGGSLSQIIFRLERDLYQNEIEEGDLVILGLTTSGRFFRLTELIDNKHVLYREYSGVIGTSKLLSQEETNFLLKWDANRIQIIWDYYTSLRHLLMLSEKYKDKCEIIMIPVLCSIGLELKIAMDNLDPKTNKINPSVKILFDMCSSLIEHPNYLQNCCTMPFYNDIILKNKGTNNLMHGRRHPKKELHQKYAEYLYTKFIKEISENE